MTGRYRGKPGLVFLSLLMSLAGFPASAQNFLDPYFGNNGISVTNILGFDGAWSVAMQSDDKIIIAGWENQFANSQTDIVLIRYNSDGTFDSSFKSGTLVHISEFSWEGAYSVAIDKNDGSIFIAGRYFNDLNWDFLIAKFNHDGILDTAFGDNGFVLRDEGVDDRAFSIDLQDDGKIIICGLTTQFNNWDFAILRFLPDGSPDNFFGREGIVKVDIGDYDDVAFSLKIQPDGKIIVCGWTFSEGSWNFALMRLNSNGSPDNSFGSDGIVTTDFDNNYNTAHSVALQKDGKYVVAGYRYYEQRNDYDIALARYNPDGSLDQTFGEQGVVFTDIDRGNEFAWSVVLQEDQKILVTGFSKSGASKSILTLRYRENGQLDYKFGDKGIALTTIYGLDEEGRSVLVQSDGKILVTGYTFNGVDTDIFLIRYLPESADSLNYEIPEKIFLYQNYPNPFNPNTTITYDLPVKEFVTLKIFNILGKEVATLLNREQIAGTHKIEFDASNLNSGVYFYRLEAGTFVETRKMVFLK